MTAFDSSLPDDLLSELHALATASLSGEASDHQIARLERLVCENDGLCKLYVRYMYISWSLRTWARYPLSDATEEQNPPRLGFLGSAIHGTGNYVSTGWPLAYLVATVIFGLGLLIGSRIYVSQPEQVARQSVPLPSPLSPLPSIVGQITGMVDCRWERKKGDSPPLCEAPEGPFRQRGTVPLFPLVSLGDKFALASGLMEITYDTGAKVILQGPVTYEVESKDGGYLSLGKLAARVEKGAAVSNHQSSIINHQLFAVRTPTAVITDLGTEFGVEVSADRAAAVCVFDGTVEVVRTATAAPFAASNLDKLVRRRLVAGQSLRLEPAGALKSVPTGALSAAFVRKLPAQRMTTGLERGLVAYWSFDDPANLGKNSVGSGDLTPLGSPAYEAAGLIGGALRLHRDAAKDMLLFNGGNGVPKGVPTGNASYSISAWYRVDAMPQKSNAVFSVFDIVGWGEATLGRANVLMLHGFSLEQVWVLNFWWDNDLVANVDMAAATGGWRHVVSTYERHGRMQYLYLDGVRIGLRAIEHRPNFATDNFAIGHRYKPLEHPVARLEWVGGLVDEIGIWNRELSEPEIARLYNNGKGFNPLARKPSVVENESARPASELAKGGETTSTSN